MKSKTGFSLVLIYLSSLIGLSQSESTTSPITITVTESSPVTTIDHTVSTNELCISNPCQNNGSCVVQGGDFVCECQLGFTGTTCETPVDPCTPNPCPVDSMCFGSENSFYCICNGNLTGPACNEVDLLVTCKEGKKYKHLLKDSLSPILCSANNNTDANDASTICHDPDNAIIFELINNPNNIFYLEASEQTEETCLYVNASVVTGPRHCVTLIAHEADDIDNRPWRQAYYNACVIFNQRPEVTPLLPFVTVNIADVSVGEPVFTAKAEDLFGWSKFTWSIAEVDPVEWTPYFEIFEDQNMTVVTLKTLPTSIQIPNQGQVVNFKIQVDDGGHPPLRSLANVTVTFINATLSCYLPDIVYVGLQKSPGGAVAQISCVGVTTSDRLQYVLDPSGFTNITIQGNGDVLVNTDSLQPGNYSAMVNVTGQFVMTSLSFIISADYFQLDCGTDSVTEIPEDTALQACTAATICTGLISDCTAQLFHGLLRDYLTITCKPENGLMTVEICVIKNMTNKKVEGFHEIFGRLDTVYGITNVTLKLNITNTVNQVPSFTIGSYVFTITEQTLVGSTVFKVNAIDPDNADTISYSLTGNDVPFNITNDGMITTAVVYNATEKQSYIFQVVAADTGSNTASATVTVSIVDVNEPPICQHQNDEYIIIIQANTSANTVIGGLQCYDVDLGNNRVLTFSPQSSYPSDLFSISSTGEIKLIGSIVASDNSNYAFNISVMDGGGLSTIVEVSVKINSNFPPTCASATLTGQISEDASLSQCISVQSNCVDPLSGVLQFSIQGLNGSEYFEIQSSTQDPIQICTKKSIKGKYGSLLLNIQVDNGFGVTFVQVSITVTDVNDPPVFLLTTKYKQLLENTLVGSLVESFKAVDNDDKGPFSELRYSIDGPSSVFQINPTTGELSVASKLNASVTQNYNFSVIATDGGGLSASIIVNITVVDINEPPVCVSPVQVIIDLTTSVGTTLNKLNCWDWDVAQDYGVIVYSTDSQANVFEVTQDGTIRVFKSIPRTLTSFNFDVTVRDKEMERNGSTVGQKIVNVQVTVNSNFPPNCTKTDISGSFDETQNINDCLDKEITCTDPTGGAVYVDIVGGNGTTLTHVRNRTTDKINQLPLNLCIKTVIKNKVGTYQVYADINNGLGVTRITWNYKILDVNEPPAFVGAPYNWSISETIPAGSSVYGFTVIDPDFDLNLRTFKVESQLRNSVPGDPVIAFLNQCCFFATTKQNATLKNLYEFDLIATDGGNLTSNTTAFIHVLDINESPKCNVNNIAFNVTLLTPVDQVVASLDCYDTDRDDENKRLKYTVQGSTYFKVNTDGGIMIAALLPRLQNSHSFSVLVSDHGNTPLSVTVSITVTVDNLIAATCQQPDITYPDTWVINKCVTVKMNCIDPTTKGNNSLTYTLSGNYTIGFLDTNVEKGTYRFCYKLTTDGNFMITVQVYNGLTSHYVNIPLEVKYYQSTPQFTQSQYSMSLTEYAPTGSTLVGVNATSPSGKITYSVTGSDLNDWATYFQIDENSGIISTKTNITKLSNTKIKLNIQALNVFSQLKSTTQAVITVIDVNEPPSCVSLDTGDKNLNVDVAVGTVIREFLCLDSDVNELNKEIAFNLSSVPDNIPYFDFEHTDSNVKVKVKQELAVNIKSYTLTLTAYDSGSPPKSTTYNIGVIVNLTPPLPTVSAYAVNSSQINVQWSYQRKDFYNVTKKFVILVSSSSDTKQIPVDSRDSLSTYTVTGLKAETDYRISVTAETLYGNTNTVPLNVQTSAIPQLSYVVSSLRITSESYSSKLGDPDSFVYVQLANKVVQQITSVLKDTPGYVASRVISFRQGSVIVDLQLSTNQSGNPNYTSDVLKNKISTGWVGDLAFDPQYFVVGQGNGYIRVTDLTADLVTITNNSQVIFTCTADLIGQVGTVTNTWMINGSPIQPSPSSRYSISKLADDPANPQKREYTLTFNPIYVRDAGTLSCNVRDSAGLSSELSKTVSVVHQPIMIIEPRSRTLSQGDNVNITCVVEMPLSHPATVVWYKNGNYLQVSSGERIIILTQYAERLEVKNLQTGAIYGCSANNTAGMGLVKTANIGVISATSANCGKDQDPAGTLWDITVEGSTDVKNCPDKKTGTATRKCMAGGVWDNPDYSNCASKELLDIKEKTEKLKEGQIVDNLQNVVTDLANLTSNSQKNFVEGEMEASMTILSNVADYSSNNVENVNDVTLERTVQCASDLLDPRYFTEWEGLLRKNKNGASSIMESVGQISVKSTERRQAKSQIIAKKNIVVENRKIENEDILFPDKSKGNYPDWVKDQTRAKISKSALTAGQPVWTSGVYYRNLTDLLQPYLIKDEAVINMKTLYDVNSDILEIAMSNPPSMFNPAIELQFENLGDNYSWNNPLCGWWDFAAKNTPNGAWSTEGCSVYRTSETITTCQCTHLTNFAVLMSPGQTPEHHILPLSIISAVGCGLSILFLIITVGVYAAFWRYVKSDRAIILMNLCVALVLAYVVFLAGVNRTENKDICTAIAALLHYLFLVAFTLMLAEGIEIAVSVLYVFSTRSRIHWMMPCCWIVPAVIVGISLGVTQLKGYGNTQFCWLSLEDGVLWAFVGPVCLIILINFIIICIVLKTMLSSHMMMTKTVREQTKSAVRSLCVILPIMGVSWVLGVFSVNEDLVIFQYIFAVCNTLQGLFIFLFHCLTNRQVHDAMKHNRRRKRSLADFTKSTSHVQTNLKGEKERESSENMQNNMDVTKKANPFLEADRQVHEIVGKLAKKEDKKNAFDGKDNEKNVGKDNNILSLDDIKISNIVRESEVSANTGGNVSVSTVTTENSKADSQNTGNDKTQNSRKDVKQKPESTIVELRGSKQSQLSGSDRGHHSGSDRGHHSGSDRGRHSGSDRGHHSGSDKGHSGSDRGHLSGSDRDTSFKGQGQVNPLRSSVVSSHKYDSLNDFYLGSVGEQPFVGGSAVYEPQRNPQIGQISESKKVPINPPSSQQTSRSYDSVMQQQRVPQSSSYQGLEPGRYSTGQQSQPQQPFILAGNPGPQNRRGPAQNPSFTSDPGLKKPTDKKGKESHKNRYSPKAKKKHIEQQPSQKQQMSHWGKAKQGAAAKKQMKSQSRDRDIRSKSGDRSRAYAVPVDPYYEQPYARHPSLENVSVQYVGFDPFGAPQVYGRPRRSRYNQWEEPQVDYW